MKRKTVALFTGVLVAVVAASAFAATFSITRARWDGEDRNLSVRGSGTRGATITVRRRADGCGARAGRAWTPKGQWRLSVERPATVPCRVQASQVRPRSSAT